jgi:2-polyprenyl-3-methyl-5-hydroxy-6-metoxy-1,4-benzoquinol methylase
MNENEARYFSSDELRLPDLTRLPARLLLKSLGIKVRRKLLGRFLDRHARLVWTRDAVSDADGPAAAVRNYLEHSTIRRVLCQIVPNGKVQRACELGCGYGRVIMVLKEFSESTKGFEREEELVQIARSLQPNIAFERVPALTEVPIDAEYDVVMTCTVLQHLTDDDARRVCDVMKRLAPRGHVLIIEKTEPNLITSNITDGKQFLSRARPVETYQEFMRPFRLASVTDRVLEPTNENPRPGSCMVFVSGGAPA